MCYGIVVGLNPFAVTIGVLDLPPLMAYFNLVRLFLILMISAIDFVAIRSEGQVELESTGKEAYAKVLTASVGMRH